jgi:hypothetical protein
MNGIANPTCTCEVTALKPTRIKSGLSYRSMICHPGKGAYPSTECGRLIVLAPTPEPL